MRKLFAAMVALCLTIGVAIANEVVFVKLDGDKITVKDGDKESTYKLGAGVDKDKLGKAKEGKTKLDITVEGDTVTAVKMKSKKKAP